MSRLTLIALASLFSFPALTQAVIIYEPSPTPAPQCLAAPHLAPYYQRQLEVLNRPYHTDAPACPDPNTTVDMLNHPAPAAPLYYRKADLLPQHLLSHPATPPGTILIIPKTLLHRPLNSFTPPKTA